jgi:hypothetical protein
MVIRTGDNSPGGVVKTAVRYRLTTPATWRSVDVGRLVGGDDASLDGAMGAVGLARFPGGQPDDVHRLTRDTLRAAGSAGALELYVFQQTVDDRSVSSSLLTSVREAISEQDHDDLDLLAMRVRVAAAGQQETMDDLSVTALPHAGDALRIERRRWVPLGEGARSVETHELQYLVPVPGVKAVLVLTFSTPNPTVAPAFRRLWDAVAATITFDA